MFPSSAALAPSRWNLRRAVKAGSGMYQKRPFSRRRKTDRAPTVFRHSPVSQPVSKSTSRKLCRRFRDSRTPPSPAGLNLWIISNSTTPVHIEVEDFRHWPLRVSAAKKGDVEYWRALRHEIDNGGREAFLFEMLNRPIGDFFPQRDVPRFNAEHKRMVDECRDPGSPREWLLECLERGELIGVVTEDRLTQEYFPWARQRNTVRFADRWL